MAVYRDRPDHRIVEPGEPEPVARRIQALQKPGQVGGDIGLEGKVEVPFCPIVPAVQLYELTETAGPLP